MGGGELQISSVEYEKWKLLLNTKTGKRNAAGQILGACRKKIELVKDLVGTWNPKVERHHMLNPNIDAAISKPLPSSNWIWVRILIQVE
nr:hypothetical protein [Desulfobacula sp.]